MTNFTPEDLVLFQYGELPTAKSRDMAEAIERYWPLREKHQVLSEATAMLDRGWQSPRPSSVSALLAYAEVPFAPPLEHYTPDWN